MEVIVRITKDEEQEAKIQEQFPNVNFTFTRNYDELMENIKTAEVLVSYGGNVPEDVIQKAENLKWLMVMAAGVDKLPVQALKEKNIIVTNARGIHKIPMAEFVFGYILQYAKQLDVFLNQQTEKVWNKRVYTQEIYGKTLVVVGTGAIGGQISQYGKVFGMKTIGVNRSGKANDLFHETYAIDYLENVLQEADYVVSVLPSTKETKYIFAEQQFKAMKNNAVFINVGRGDAVNEKDLMDALNNGELGHAFLDVFEKEPLAEDHPFWRSDKVTITPHVVALTDMYLPRAYEIFSHNLRIYINGENEFINLVDLNRGY